MSKSKKAPVAEPIEPLASVEPPTCPECLAVLTWRDAAYVLGSNLCKRCHQRHAKTKQRGVFHPATVQVKRGEKLVSVPVRSNRAQRRHGQATVATAQPPTPQQHRRTRATRRAVARQAKALAAVEG